MSRIAKTRYTELRAAIASLPSEIAEDLYGVLDDHEVYPEQIIGSMATAVEAERVRGEAEVDRVFGALDRLLEEFRTEYVGGKWVYAGEYDPDAVVTYSAEPSPETGHVGWCCWAGGKMGEASSYEEAKRAAEEALARRVKP